MKREKHMTYTRASKMVVEVQLKVDFSYSLLLLYFIFKGGAKTQTAKIYEQVYLDDGLSSKSRWQEF